MLPHQHQQQMAPLQQQQQQQQQQQMMPPPPQQQQQQQQQQHDPRKAAELQAAQAAAQGALMAELEALRRHKAMTEEQQRRLDAQVNASFAWCDLGSRELLRILLVASAGSITLVSSSASLMSDSVFARYCMQQAGLSWLGSRNA